jgi:hypothetical protein
MGRYLLPAQVPMHMPANAGTSFATSRVLSLKQVKGDFAEKKKVDLGDIYNSPVATTRSLQQFAKVVAQNVGPKVQGRKDPRLTASIAESRIQDETLPAVHKRVSSEKIAAC